MQDLVVPSLLVHEINPDPPLGAYISWQSASLWMLRRRRKSFS